MKLQTRLRLGVISDIHATLLSDKSSANALVTSPPEAGKKNPLSDLLNFIDKERIEFDYLLCPGDITNQADHHAFEWMWNQLHDLKTKAKATDLIAVCGNHDLDSRYLKDTEDPDPKGALLNLKNPFPNLNESDLNKFWARHYVVLERSNPAPHRIVLLNTCAYHGGAQEEIKHGRISAKTIERIRTELADKDCAGINILLCHHHLHPLPAWGTESDYQYVKKGGELLIALENLAIGPWLVVHGHRHWPDCFYAQGGSSSAVVFCSSSFGVSNAQITNQFHVLDIEINAEAPRPKGQIKSWTWTLSTGWTDRRIAHSDKSFGPMAGFGYYGGIPSLVTKIQTLIPQDGYLQWQEFIGRLPEITYLLQSEYLILKTNLAKIGISIYEEDGAPVQIAKR